MKITRYLFLLASLACFVPQFAIAFDLSSAGGAMSYQMHNSLQITVRNQGESEDGDVRPSNTSTYDYAPVPEYVTPQERARRAVFTQAIEARIRTKLGYGNSSDILSYVLIQENYLTFGAYMKSRRISALGCKLAWNAEKMILTLSSCHYFEGESSEPIPAERFGMVLDGEIDFRREISSLYAAECAKLSKGTGLAPDETVVVELEKLNREEIPGVFAPSVSLEVILEYGKNFVLSVDSTPFYKLSRSARAESIGLALKYSNCDALYPFYFSGSGNFVGISLLKARLKLSGIFNDTALGPYEEIEPARIPLGRDRAMRVALGRYGEALLYRTATPR